MHPILFGIFAGLIFGVIDVLLMIPMQHPDKKTAMLGAFLSRFAIGFLIPLCSRFPAPMIVTGIVVALLVSLPDAVITKAYVPILAIGVLGGAIIGWLAGRLT